MKFNLGLIDPSLDKRRGYYYYYSYNYPASPSPIRTRHTPSPSRRQRGSRELRAGPIRPPCRVGRAASSHIPIAYFPLSH